MSAPVASGAKQVPLGQNAAVLRALRADFEAQKEVHETSINTLTKQIDAYCDRTDARILELEEDGRKKDKALFDTIKAQDARLQTLERVLKILTADASGEPATATDIPVADVVTGAGDPMELQPNLKPQPGADDEEQRLATSLYLSKNSQPIKVHKIHIVFRMGTHPTLFDSV